MSVQQVQQNVKPIPPAVPNRSTERNHRAFSQINALPMSFSIKPDDTVSLYRARMDNRNVILRVLKVKWGSKSTIKFSLTSANLTFSYLRHGKQCWQATLLGVRILLVGTRAAPVPSFASGRGFSPVAPRDGRGGASAQRPAGLPVAMPTGTAVTNGGGVRTFHFVIRETKSGVSNSNTERGQSFKHRQSREAIKVFLKIEEWTIS